MNVRVLRAPFVLTGEEVLRDGALALEGDELLAVGSAGEVERAFGEAESLDAILLPAFVNAHLHLELSYLAGRVGGGEGLPSWIQLFLDVRATASQEQLSSAMTMAAEDLVAAGVAAVGDVTNTLVSLAPLAQEGLLGSVYLEVLGLTADRYRRTLTQAKEALAGAPRHPGLAVYLSPHAVYSTLPEAISSLLEAGPASIHLSEDPAERELCAHGTGPFARMAAALRAPTLGQRSRSAVAAVAKYLRPHHLAVHCVDLDPLDVDALAKSGATVVLCPRSNLHINGRLPPLPALLEARVPLAIGTDSLASSPSLSPLAELVTLRSMYPAIPAAQLLALAWNGAAVGVPHVGRLRKGTAPGVLSAALFGARPSDPFQYLLEAHGTSRPTRPLKWLARARPEGEP